jgi:hypothetical protein
MLTKIVAKTEAPKPAKTRRGKVQGKISMDLVFCNFEDKFPFDEPIPKNGKEFTTTLRILTNGL